MIGDTEMSVFIYDTSTLRRMEMLRAWGLCVIRRCEDKGSVVGEALRARVLLGVRTKAALLGRHCVRGCYWDKAV